VTKITTTIVCAVIGVTCVERKKKTFPCVQNGTTQSHTRKHTQTHLKYYCNNIRIKFNRMIYRIRYFKVILTTSFTITASCMFRRILYNNIIPDVRRCGSSPRRISSLVLFNTISYNRPLRRRERRWSKRTTINKN